MKLLDVLHLLHPPITSPRPYIEYLVYQIMMSEVRKKLGR
jgi:hypothetical protein